MPAAKKEKSSKGAKGTKGTDKGTRVKDETSVIKTNSESTPAPVNTEGLAVVYPTLEIVEYSTVSPMGPITPDLAKTMMGWEEEYKYQKRMVEENPGSKPEEFLYGEVYHCIDEYNCKVQCWNNANNRSFDANWCEALVHTILQGQWAGPLTIPGETINGEAVRIGRHGMVLSAQHQLSALILADQALQKSRAEEGNILNPRYPFWNGHEYPVIETIVVTGLSEDERVLRTIDYVKPRTVADMLYTMPLYRDNTPPDRKELTRMLAIAIDTLWDRTNTQGYGTHPEIVGFLERHNTLLQCVQHIFAENRSKALVAGTYTIGAYESDNTWGVMSSGGVILRGGFASQELAKRWALAEDGGRKISKLKISAGQASALMYLMGSGTEKTTDYSDTYRNEKPPSEKNLDWGYWDKAKDFWARLASDRSFKLVRDRLTDLYDSSKTNPANLGMGGTSAEKLAVLAKAWERWKYHNLDYGHPFEEVDLAPGGLLHLTYTDIAPPKINEKETVGGEKMPDGEIRLVEDMADFFGIDCPEVINKGKKSGRTTPPPSGGLDPTPEEMEQMKLDIHKRREQAEKLKEEKASRKKK